MIVTLTDDAHAPGDVWYQSPGLIRGAIDRFGPAASPNAGMSVNLWVSITTKALAMFDANNLATPMRPPP